MALYYCNHCLRTVHRPSRKQWLKSFCERVGRTVRLMRVKKVK